MRGEDAEVATSSDAHPLPKGAPEALIRQIADHSPVVTLVASRRDACILYANRAATSAARDEVVGRSAIQAFAFVDPTLLATPTQAQAHAVAQPRGEATTWWDVSYLALDGPSSEAPCVLITAVDVTHHARARSESEGALEAMLACIPEGVGIARGPEATIERFSSRGVALSGADARSLVGLSALQQTGGWEVYQPGADVPLAPADRPLSRATRTGESRMNEALVVRRPDGGFLSVLCNSAPIRDAAGRVTGAVMAWRDVDELKRAHKAMRDTEELLRAVLLQVPAGVFIVEAPDGRVTFRSRTLDETLGDPDIDMERARTSLRGWAMHADGSPYDLSEYPSRRALWQGETIRAEPMIYRRGDGRLIDLEMYAGPVHGANGEVVAAVAVAIDVTERRRTEARQAFLYRLQDCLRALSDPREIVVTAARCLGRHLGAARVGYGEMQPDDQAMLVINGYADGAPPVDAVMPLSLMGPHNESRMRRGETLVFEDALADAAGAREFALAFGARAHVAAPLVRDGRLTGCLHVSHAGTHVWDAADVALVEAVAARIWDAAERSRAEARLRDSEERLRLVMESSELGVWEYDAATEKTLRSPRHAEVFGYAEPLADWSWERFEGHVHPEDRERVSGGLREALKQATDWDVEFRIVRADGAPGWAQVLARVHHDADGRIARVLGTIADITARKTAEQAVLETAAKFETLAQTLPNMIWTSLPDGQMEWLNARVPEYCGLPPDDLTPDGWSPVHPDDREASTRRWREAVASGTPYVDEYRIRRHDGMFRWHITRAVPIRGADGAIIRWIGSSADIHDQKSSEEALAQLNTSLEQQVRDRTRELLAAEATLRQSQKMEAVGQLTGGLAHDFNNLLTGITGSLELMATRLEQGKLSEIGRYLQTAQTAAQRAASLTHRLLAFSRRQTLDPKPTRIGELVRGMDELIRRTVGPSITVQVEEDAELWTVLADPHQLESALLNLCLNARDAMPDGGALRIRTVNEALAEPEAGALELPVGDYVRLSVSDTGSGMTSEVIARAFDPFFTTKPIGQGTGLGLSMVYGFVRQSGGQALIESELGHGARISLYLPRHIDDGTIVEPPAAPAVVERGEGRTVLVVDDEPSVRQLITEVLGDLGYQVLEAETGAGGLAVLASTHGIDLLVTDVGLPGGMNGRQLADAALFGRPDLKVLFITGYAELAVFGDGYVRPPMYILTKPFTVEALGNRVGQIVAS